MTKKSLITDFKKLVDGGASPVEVKNAIQEANPELKLEEVDEVVMELFDIKEPEKETGEAATPVSAGDHPMTKGKNLYDIYRGKWEPRESVQGFDGKDYVVKWEFIPEGKAIRTGVPMEPHRAQAFNEGKRVRALNVYTEQMVPAGSSETIFDDLPDPTQRKKINQ